MFVRGAATILHADLDAFYASVEQRDDVRLRGRPVIVGGGVVLAASYEAKACGVRTAMNGRQARALCPSARVVPPRMEAYSAASKAVFAIFRDTTPSVEGLSIDEAFMEVGGLWKIVGSPEEIARRLRARVATEVGLPITVGVARTKFLAKVASGVAKPDGLLVVPPDGETDFLHPLAVERLWGVGRVTAEKLHALDVHTVGEVAGLGERALVSFLGKASGRHLHALAHGLDPRPVDTGKRRRSIGSQRALGRRPRSEEELDAILAGIVDRLARRLRGGRDSPTEEEDTPAPDATGRIEDTEFDVPESDGAVAVGSGPVPEPRARRGRVCRTVVLRLRFGDFTRATRSHTLAVSTAHTPTLLEAARALLLTAMPLIREKGITLLGLSLSNLDGDGAVQLELPLDAHSGPALDVALDAVRARFGSSSVSRAVNIHRDDGLLVPLLPEHQ
ncbi:DNA polymerase IV [Pseudonocardia endophytica]|uniref:DNA polymerase IV n=1 Tax=Pseudonocardia endophytica TaxID=401976 RepID=A0A4R1HLX2_PSEEN|nr:DNA polymerase IV [Pseudonocardia endophytica]TCK21525.1 DNA polymerase-4 [Pseudonocardia endophytica]